MGVVFRRLIHLMWEALPADKSHLRPFVDGIALACGTPHPTAATPLSALVSQWKQVPYSKPSLAGAATAWERPRGTPEARTNHFDSLFGGGPRQDDQQSATSPFGTRMPVGDAPSKCKEAGGARDSITHYGDDSAQHWRGASVIQASTPAQCREMCQLCDNNVSQAASQWTEASATGVMTSVREEQRHQRDKGEYACAARKMTSSTSASGAAWDNKDDAERVILYQEVVVSIALCNWLCDDNVSPAALQWTEAIAYGVMTSYFGGSECLTPSLRWRAPPRPGRGPVGHLRHRQTTLIVCLAGAPDRMISNRDQPARSEQGRR
jgi:hypothetical protein